MRIQNINVSNAFINYEDLLIDLPGSGLYFLLGENGSGKSSLIREILFGKVKIVFDRPGEEVFSGRKKHALFAYMPQELISCSISVEEYLCRENPNVDHKLQESLMQYFGLSSLNRKEKVYRLSGGELTKLALVSAFSKNTPYIILDEPSNYLDDASVHLLAGLLEREGKRKAILIASHDARLTEMKGTRFQMDAREGHLNLLEETPPGVTPQGQWNQRVQVERIGRKRIQKGLFLVLFVTCFVLLAGFSFFILYHFATNLQWGEGLKDDPENTVLVNSDPYDDYGYETSSLYLKELHLSVPEEQSHRNMFKASDISSIVNDNERILFLEDPRLYKLAMYNEGNPLEYEELYPGEGCPWEEGLEEILISIPEIIYDSELFSSWLISTKLYLVSGRLPRDGEREIALSEKLLKRFFDLGYEEAVGKELSINGKMYTLVGQLFLDYCMVSYEEDCDYIGIYRYKAESFDAYWESVTALREAQDIYPLSGPEVFLVVCRDAEDAENCFKEYLARYPRSLFMSSFASKLYYRSYARKLFLEGLLLFGGIALGAGTILGLEVHYLLRIARKKKKLYEEYYLEQKRLLRGFRKFIFEGMFISFAAGILTVAILAFLFKAVIQIWGLVLALLIPVGIMLYLPSVLWIHYGFKAWKRR